MFFVLAGFLPLHKEHYYNKNMRKDDETVMSKWTNIKAVIDINIDNWHVDSDDVEAVASAEYKILVFFASKFMGSRGAANIYCNFDSETSTEFGFDEKGESIIKENLHRCSVTISGFLQDVSKNEILSNLESIILNINKDKDIYIEYWSSIGAVWEEDEPKTDIYPILEELCKDE